MQVKILISAVLSLTLPLCGCLTLSLCGCKAGYWGGDTAGKRPGLEMHGPSLFRGARLEATADSKAKLGKAKYEVIRTEDGKTTSTFEMTDLDYGQTVDSVISAEAQKLNGIALVQRTQTEYVSALLTGIRGIVHELMPLLSLLAAADIQTTESGFTFTLPNGFSIGNKKVETPADIKDIIDSTMSALQPLTDTAPNTAVSGPPASQPSLN